MAPRRSLQAVNHRRGLSPLRRLGAAVGVTAATFAPGPAVHAAPGDLDASFGTGGIVWVDFRNAYDVAVYSNGGIVTVGVAVSETGFDWGVVRIRPDGGLDEDFGSGGQLTTDFGGGFDYATAVAFQPDGRIVVAGTTGTVTGSGRDFAVARYLSDGTLDPSFGSLGRATTDFAGAIDDPSSIVVQPDGRIVVGGTSVTPFGVSFAVARFDSRGILDASFGTGGRVTTGSNASGHALTLQRDGRILLAGSTVGATADFIVARYRRDGSLDRSFGSDGVVTTDFGGADAAVAIVPQDGGRLVATGSTIQPGEHPSELATVRYKANGNLDGSFGAGGKVVTDLDGGYDFAGDAAATSDGKLLVVGSTAGAVNNTGSREDLALAVVRYDQDGTLDASFGSGGIVVNDISDTDDSIEAVALQPNGHAVAAGLFGGSPNSFGIARYLG